MKTNSINKRAKIVTFIFMVFGIFTLSAQCPTIENASNCNVTINFSIIDNIPPSGCVAANTCNSQTGVLVLANSSGVPLNCGGCSNICNVIITVTDIGGTSQTVICDFSSGPQTVSAALSCNLTFNQIEYFPSINAFKIH